MNQGRGQIFWEVIPLVPPFLLGCILALLYRSCIEGEPEESAAALHAPKECEAPTEADEPQISDLPEAPAPAPAPTPIEIPNESLWAVEACIRICSTRGGIPVISPSTRPQDGGWRCLCDLTEPQE